MSETFTSLKIFIHLNDSIITLPRREIVQETKNAEQRERRELCCDNGDRKRQQEEYKNSVSESKVFVELLKHEDIQQV